MMTFKGFYLGGSNSAKAPPRASTSFKTPKRRNEILDRIAKLKAAKRRSALRGFDNTAYSFDQARSQLYRLTFLAASI